MWSYGLSLSSWKWKWRKVKAANMATKEIRGLGKGPQWAERPEILPVSEWKPKKPSGHTHS